jgi:transketolase
VVSIDFDLASTSGLQVGVGAVDQSRALNVGVAKANMMGIGEAFAALGFNAWVSTSCPSTHRGRAPGATRTNGGSGRLVERRTHGLDLTLLATGANFEACTDGATHMGNDDITIFDAYIRRGLPLDPLFAQPN